MKLVNWTNLTAAEQKKCLLRPLMKNNKELKSQVKMIIRHVKQKGDAALIEFTKIYDQVNLDNLKVTKDEFDRAYGALTVDAKTTLEFAKNQIEKNHKTQLPMKKRMETASGVFCERHARPIENVGLYVPGGAVPLVSSVLMLAVPAAIAGCTNRILCTPPNRQGEVDPHVLVAAKTAGITSVYKVGGAQAIAAMAFGTETIPKVEKIFGPGNRWVTEAKMHVSQAVSGPSIDMPAGPSELLVIADDNANAAYIAADLLSQAEHGIDSQVILIALSEAIAARVTLEISQQSADLPRQSIIQQALSNSCMIIAKDLLQAFEISNTYAPEHVILHVDQPERFIENIKHAGAVFLGAFTPETVGDYVTGSNHVLPTYGYARKYSGLGVVDFMKFISFQTVTKIGLENIGKYAENLAKMEGLEAHRRAVALRLRDLTRGAAA